MKYVTLTGFEKYFRPDGIKCCQGCGTRRRLMGVQIDTNIWETVTSLSKFGDVDAQ